MTWWIAVAVAAFVFSLVYTLYFTARQARFRRNIRLQFQGRLVDESSAPDIIGRDVGTEALGGEQAHIAAKIVDFDLRRFPLQIVISRHRRKPNEVRRLVSLEDLKATECILRIRPDILSTRAVSDLFVPPDAVDLDGSQNSLLLVGSPETNPATEKVMSMPDVADAFAATFKTLEEQIVTRGGERTVKRAFIMFGEKAYQSEIYALEEEFSLDPIGFKKPFSDFGLIVKVDIPYRLRPSRQGKRDRVIIVAGVGGLGTWGAARCLYDQADLLLENVGSGQFAAIVRAEREHGKETPPTAELRAVSVPGPKGPIVTYVDEGRRRLTVKNKAASARIARRA